MKFTNVGSNLLILGLFALGCLVGFIIISKIMSILLKKFEYQTFMALLPLSLVQYLVFITL